jgi:hypothetical protein
LSARRSIEAPGARPTRRPRHPAGGLAELDGALVSEARQAGLVNAASDTRRLRAPLPQLSIGSVVEQEIIVADHERVPGGAVVTVALGKRHRRRAR